ncbi:urotensin 1 [Latimeria chalumnae]|uniref:Urocortin n=1 Tax=Latimeria chalumnae TaxID=7897 RepID=H3ANJ2_LATCH|nr:PREDICTED: urocortin [Latimeria chalumnae]|eukprot:XP_005999303.1 PREDICTED: urocortin [Latimeria chalumnae]
MKTAPLVLLAVYLMLIAHVRQSVCRPTSMNNFDRYGSNFNRVLNEMGDQALFYFMREKLLKYLEGDPRFLTSLAQILPDQAQFLDETSTRDVGHLLAALELVLQDALSNENSRASLEEFSERLKREDPPISIDLTFHILRQMIEIAKTQNQKHQAEQNRIIFDSVGK